MTDIYFENFPFTFPIILVATREVHYHYDSGKSDYVIFKDIIVKLTLCDYNFPIERYTAGYIVLS